MTVLDRLSYAQLYQAGHFGTYAHALKCPGGLLDLVEVQGPAGDVSRPAVQDIVLYQDVLGGCRINGDLGRGRFELTTTKGDIIVAPPDFATTTIADSSHWVRSIAFPMAQWKDVLEQATDGRFSFDSSCTYGSVFGSHAIQATLRTVWGLCNDEGAPSRLLTRAAGFEILAELSRLGGTPFKPAIGGLAPWAERRCIELMHARIAEDVSLDELAAEAQLSPFHFARMFKQSLGVPPRVYLTRLRMDRACELLEMTDLSVTQIALKVGYSSSQVLARVFLRNLNMSPTDYRRAVCDPTRGANQPQS